MIPKTRLQTQRERLRCSRPKYWNSGKLTRPRKLVTTLSCAGFHPLHARNVFETCNKHEQEDGQGTMVCLSTRKCTLQLPRQQMQARCEMQRKVLPTGLSMSPRSFAFFLKKNLNCVCVHAPLLQCTWCVFVRIRMLFSH